MNKTFTNWLVLHLFTLLNNIFCLILLSYIKFRLCQIKHISFVV